MYRWIDDYLASAEMTTHQMNVAREGYGISAHCSGFDLYGTKRGARLFLNSWRNYISAEDLFLVDEVVGRAGVF